MRKRVGQYNIQQPNCPIGHGQSAAVYLATHTDTPQEVVALKFFHLFAPEKRVQRTFLRETQIITRLNHPNIIRVLHIGFDRSNPYYVMSYAPGGNLGSKIVCGSHLSSEAVDVYLQQIAAAIQHVHDNGLVHCDLKPENILIAADGTLLLADFGITRSIQTIQAQSTQTGAGTAWYMAPEQFVGKPDMASDQYALGVMAYELLAGVKPFIGSNTMVLMNQHIGDEPPSLLAKNPAVSPRLEAVIFRALEKKPEKRFPSVLDFAKSFHEAIYGPVETDQAVSSGITKDYTIFPRQFIKFDKETITAQKRAMGQRLRRERMLRGWTQEYVARLTSYTVSYISAWENGRMLPARSSWKVIASAFETTVDDLFSTYVNTPTSLHKKENQELQDEHTPDVPAQENSGFKGNECRIMVPEFLDDMVVNVQTLNTSIPIGRDNQGYKYEFQLSSDYYSCFILSAGQDQEFVQNLYTDLRSKNVPCRFMSIDGEPHNHTRIAIHEAIEKYNKTLLVFSEDSLRSDWLEYEAKFALDIERRKDEDILLPVFLDSSIAMTKENWVPTFNKAAAGNFIKWQDPNEYAGSLKVLLKNLKRPLSQ